MFFLVYTYESEYLLTSVFIGVLLIIQVYLLVKFVDRTNRDLTSFLESIRFSEFTRSFQVEGMGSSFDELSKAFNDVINDFQAVRSEKEEQYHYLQSIVQNTDVSILAFQKDGTVELINKAAKRLFQVQSFKNIKSLETLSPDLVNTLLNLKPGTISLVKVQEDDDILQLAISATEIKIQHKLIIVSTIKNIQTVLEEQETEAWQKLIRVLTHEIMNSITPIASLTATLDLMLKDATNNQDLDEYIVDKDTIMEFQKALQTINKRSTGLLHFVNTYRNLTRIPKPNFKITRISTIFSNIKSLMEKEISTNKIRLTMIIDPDDLEISADEELIEQVLINLVKNSIHALEKRENPEIKLDAHFNKRGHPTIQVSDNGVGILKDVIDKIFIPFFTTKQKGSGIGLSLSRQILRLHGGTISVHSEPEQGTTFTLTF
jgi:nitrogen fixation/metabolism regulation signal transduction histidine kinase